MAPVMVLASLPTPPSPAVIQVSFQLKIEETREKENHLENYSLLPFHHHLCCFLGEQLHICNYSFFLLLQLLLLLPTSLPSLSDQSHLLLSLSEDHFHVLGCLISFRIGIDVHEDIIKSGDNSIQRAQS